MMKVEKNKIVFASVLICIMLFIGIYATTVMGDEEEPVININQIPVPKLEDQQKVYQSKLDALNDLKEVRQTNAPSIYDERLLDSTGVYDPNLLDKEKMRLVDSIYRDGQITYLSNNYRSSETKTAKEIIKPKIDSILPKIKPTLLPKELALEHQLFFASDPLKDKAEQENQTDETIYVIVDGDQIVKTNYRLQMRLDRDAIINDIHIARNTPIYGFISFKPNRVMITIENINHQPVKLKAFDLQDGSEGIYIENSFRAEARQEVVGDIVDDINIGGVPQVSGIKKLFQRDNRTVKVTITNNYRLILKVHNGQ